MAPSKVVLDKMQNHRVWADVPLTDGAEISHYQSALTCIYSSGSMPVNNEL